VMTKAHMMDALDDVFTDRRLRRADVESALTQTLLEPVPLLGRYIARPPAAVREHAASSCWTSAP
jgi:hypothetical protein